MKAFIAAAARSAPQVRAVRDDLEIRADAAR